MKIAVLGTSHTACIKAGYDLCSNDLKSVINVEFFAVGGNLFSFFEQEEDGVFRITKGNDADRALARKQAVNINGKEQIDLNDVDVICITGAQTGIEAVARLMAQVDIEHPLKEGPRTNTLVSSSTFAGIQSDLIEDALQKWPLMQRDGIRQFLLPSPFPFEKFLEPRVGRMLGKGTKRQLQDNPDYVPTILSYIENLRSAFLKKSGVRLLDQPTETTTKDRVISDDAFCRGALTLGGALQPVEDFTHANPEYGQLFWQVFAKTLGISERT